MKKACSILIAAALLLTGCSGTKRPVDVKLMEGANTENSAVALYVSDGESTTLSWLFNGAEFINAVNSAKVYEAPTDLDVTTVSKPFYGITCGTAEGEVGGMLADGIWVSREGEVYLTDLDLAALSEGQNWNEPQQINGIYMPGLWYVARFGGEWHTQFLNKAEEPADRGVELAITSVDGATVSATLTDTTGEENCVGEYYSLQAKIDGEWYDIPSEEELFFKDLGYLIPANGTITMTYHLDPYGDLPAGTYRIAAEGDTAEFTIE